MSENTENFEETDETRSRSRSRASHDRATTEAKKRENLQQYETTIRRKVKCEEKAFHTVNKLIYGSVEAQYLIDCAEFINRDNYGDVVEERAISSLCGYPLCEEELKSVPKQKYHISTKSNKVYDITERKNFCSNQCLKASKAFQLQIPESPVWARELEPTHVFTLLPHKSVKGIIGTEVVGQAPWRHLKDEVTNLGDGSSSADKKGKRPNTKSKVDHSKSTSKLTSSRESQRTSHTLNNEPCTDSNEDNLSKDFENLSIEKTSLNTPEGIGLKENSLTCLKGCENIKTCPSRTEQELKDSSTLNSDVKNDEENREKKEVKAGVSPLERLNLLLAKKKNVLLGMVDIQEVASCNVTSTKSSKSLISETDSKSHSPTSAQAKKITVSDSHRNTQCHQKTPMGDNSSSQNDRHLKSFIHQSPLKNLCRILQPWITENTKQYLKSHPYGEENSDASIFSDPKIQSGYIDLCRRLDLQEKDSSDVLGEVRDIKIKSDASKLQSVPDYQRLKEESEQFQFKVTEFITGKRVKDQKLAIAEKDAEDNDPIFLPTVDIYDQMMIRAKIVFDRLDKTIPELMAPMGLTVQDVSINLKELIYTFRLERDNIIFKPSEWTLVSLILLKMLALKVKAIELAFKKETAINYVNILLKGIGHNLEDLHAGVDSLLQGKNS